jgi:tRNA(Glu) U13 pseudouridine synthase TruD
LPAQANKNFDNALGSALAHGLSPDNALQKASRQLNEMPADKPTATASLSSGKNIDTLLSSAGHSRVFDRVLGKALERGVPVEKALVQAKRAEAESAANFELPRQFTTNAKVEFKTSSGESLPSWLHYTPETNKLTAYDIPQGALPMKITMSVNGKAETVEITETGIHK